eukprot:12423875-Karenia_brevis.AAC.1
MAMAMTMAMAIFITDSGIEDGNSYKTLHTLRCPHNIKQGSGYAMAMAMAMAIFITGVLNDSAIKERGFIIDCPQ